MFYICSLESPSCVVAPDVCSWWQKTPRLETGFVLSYKECCLMLNHSGLCAHCDALRASELLFWDAHDCWLPQRSELLSSVVPVHAFFSVVSGFTVLYFEEHHCSLCWSLPVHEFSPVNGDSTRAVCVLYHTLPLHTLLKFYVALYLFLATLSRLPILYQILCFYRPMAGNTALYCFPTLRCPEHQILSLGAVLPTLLYTARRL